MCPVHSGSVTIPTIITIIITIIVIVIIIIIVIVVIIVTIIIITKWVRSILEVLLPIRIFQSIAIVWISELRTRKRVF